MEIQGPDEPPPPGGRRKAYCGTTNGLRLLEESCNGLRSSPPADVTFAPRPHRAVYSPFQKALQSGPRRQGRAAVPRRSETLSLRAALRGSRRGRRARQTQGLIPARSPVEAAVRYKIGQAHLKSRATDTRRAWSAWEGRAWSTTWGYWLSSRSARRRDGGGSIHDQA